jgi:hypothetical protein
VIRSKPVVVPVPVQPDLFDERAWRRNSRRVQTQRFLDRCGRSGTADIATVTGVSPRAVNYWRRGTVAPTAKHYRQLMALQTLLERVQQLALAHASSY